MDARQKQIYNALFSVRDDGSLERLTPDRAVSLADLAEELADDSRPKTIAGDGAKLCLDALNAAGISRCRIAPPHLVMQNAVSVAPGSGGNCQKRRAGFGTGTGSRLSAASTGAHLAGTAKLDASN